MSTYPPPNNAQPAQENIPNYLVWSIVATVLSTCFCCPLGLIGGIVAIVFSSQVNTKLQTGDIEGARASSNNAKIWCWVTTGLGIVGFIGNIIYFLAVGASGYTQYMQQGL